MIIYDLRNLKGQYAKGKSTKHILSLFKAGYGGGIMSPKFLQLKVTYFNLKFIFHVMPYHDFVKNCIYVVSK